jgi:class 3 adenylate cyclase
LVHSCNRRDHTHVLITTAGQKNKRKPAKPLAAMRITASAWIHFDDDVNNTGEPGDNTAVSSTSEDRNPGHDDSPDALIRRENQMIRSVKALAVLVLIVAALVAAGVIFEYTHGTEKSSFQNDFILISEAITQTLLQDCDVFISSAVSIATTMTIVMEAYNETQLTFGIPLPRYESMASDRVTLSDYVSWNPLIRSDEERRQFEAMVASREQEGYFDSLSSPTCFVCGDEDMAPSTPDVVVAFSGANQFSCEYLEYAGKVGGIDEFACPYVTSRVVSECSCSPSKASSIAEDVRSPSEGIFRFTNDDNFTAATEPWLGGPYMPMFLDILATSNRQPLMYNHLSHPKLAHAASQMIFSGIPQTTDMLTHGERTFYQKYSLFQSDPDLGPSSVLYYPVRNPQDTEIAGAISLHLSWGNLLRRRVPTNGQKVNIVVESSCGQVHTYKVRKEGVQMEWIGEGDLHDRKYDHMAGRTSFRDFTEYRLSYVKRDYNTTQEESCDYRFSVYPTAALEDTYITNSPRIYAMFAILIFFFTSLVFMVYDYMVRRRQTKIMAAAKQTDTIVSSLFPQNVRDRLYQQAHGPNEIGDGSASLLSRTRNTFWSGPQVSVFGSAPIADFFPSCTVMFLDIANFTAWCSEREPSQVFVLLENVYHEFDQIADQLGVFKVETIGDSYVAVAGLPTPRKDHAVVMTRFACMCLSRMEQRVQELEVSLGPSTGDLRARCGLHSGPVTAGVLRGAKARFQLFGDTVNTASRMESSSVPSRIHASEQTVNFLIKSNKATWAVPREDKVHLKGKGTLQTFWLDPRHDKSQSAASRQTSAVSNVALSDGPYFAAVSTNVCDSTLRKKRLIEWNVEVLHDLLSRVVASRNAIATSSETALPRSSLGKGNKSDGRLVIDEMTEIIALPRFDPKVHQNLVPVVLPGTVKEQLHEFVSNIANLYREEVPFHNFEHASHVIMSATKLMKRIMSPEGIDWDLEGVSNEDERRVEIARQVHEVTYGLSSDPLMQFSVVFSALIHDVDHTGLTNRELIDMNAPLADLYRSKCVAEQNSVDVAWQLLMEDNYWDLRNCIFSNNHEELRFRELVVDAVLATDIADKELGTLRKSRWEQAFAVGFSTQTRNMDMDRKATIVFEHIIQASDVCHCMQHWHTYQKYNSRLFEERYVAYRKGVAGENPPWTGWYNGEIWFFDNYIIPLAQKLHDCGVFGVSYHEYLNYAQENRLEWERKGQEIVERLRAEVESKYEGVVFHNEPTDTFT